MCTVTWLQDQHGYLLLSNRDERPTRLPGIAPRVSGSPVRYIAPLDGDHAGTWIGVNEFGLAACLLNGVSSGSTVDAALFTTRGIVVHQLLACSTYEQVRSRISKLELPRLRPFTVIALEPNREPLLVRWSSSQELSEETEPVQMPLFSTAREQAIAARREHFGSLLSAYGIVTPELLYEFHSSHIPERGPLSVCMHGDVSNTVSFSKVTVTSESVGLAYYPSSPCVFRAALAGAGGARAEWEAGRAPLAGTVMTLRRRAPEALSHLKE